MLRSQIFVRNELWPTAFHKVTRFAGSYSAPPGVLKPSTRGQGSRHVAPGMNSETGLPLLVGSEGSSAESGLTARAVVDGCSVILISSPVSYQNRPSAFLYVFSC